MMRIIMMMRWRRRGRMRGKRGRRSRRKNDSTFRRRSVGILG